MTARERRQLEEKLNAIPREYLEAYVRSLPPPPPPRRDTRPSRTIRPHRKYLV